MGVLGTINKQCGCIRLWPNGFVPMWGAYIGEDSTKNPYSHDYQPYISETEENTFYVQENYDPMSDTDPIARKHSEDADITEEQLIALAPYVKFVIIRPEDEENPNSVQMANNNLSLADLLAYIAGSGGVNQKSFNFQVVDDASILEDVLPVGRTFVSASWRGNTYNTEHITQSGRDLTNNQGYWEAGTVITINME